MRARIMKRPPMRVGKRRTSADVDVFPKPMMVTGEMMQPISNPMSVMSQTNQTRKEASLCRECTSGTRLLASRNPVVPPTMAPTIGSTQKSTSAVRSVCEDRCWVVSTARRVMANDNGIEGGKKSMAPMTAPSMAPRMVRLMCNVPPSLRLTASR
jgi:hypothetical protein